MHERPPLRWRVLGDLVAVAPGATPIGGPTQRRSLGLLVAHRNETVAIDQIVDACWPGGDAPARADHNVRTYIHRLRNALGELDDRLRTSAGGYRLHVEPDELDIDRYMSLSAEVERLLAIGDAPTALDRADEAEALWQGRPFAELADEPWAVAETSRLTQRHAALASARVEALLVAGRPNEAVGALDAVIVDQPLAERPRALLMRALYESGRHAEALRAFQDFRRHLIDDAGVEPSPDLVELDRRIATGSVPMSVPERRVGNYALHERIGEGAFAVVHRATQPSLGREVAVKIVRAELANHPDFIRRFEAEAQMVASIEHPNVVPLYDYWREPGNAYLVMRWMTGGSLETRLDHGPMPLDAVVDLVDQIADALDAAHRHDIVHRDVKPANILFDGSDRAFLTDFGIALAADERATPHTALSEGSPVFASPEQLRREAAGPEADVHALGIVAYTALVGRTPFHETTDDAELLRRQLTEPVPAVSAHRPELPPTLDEVIALATDKDPSRRFPTTGAFATAFRAAALDRRPPVSMSAIERYNPYVGLRAFSATDTALFHGRARLIDELLDVCGDPSRRLVTVVGPSGCGKSSVVRAGLVPALRAGRVPGSAGWFVTTMVPGAHPYEALETALLRIAVNPPAALLEQLRDGDRGVHRAVSRIRPDSDGTVLLVIDQLEELFTLTDETTRRRFLRALATAATEPGGPLRIVATMRADFFDQPLRHPEFAALFKASTVAVTPLAPDELEAAITMPAATVGVGFERGLVAEIVADVNRQPGALPLMQYALTQLFEATDGDELRRATYDDIGRLAGALGRRAESLYSALTADEQAAAARLFTRLVTLGDGIEDTRRRAHRSELVDHGSSGRVLDVFGDARLVTFDRDAGTREPTVEITHEALIREWPRLRAWLDDDRDGLRIHRHITDTATAWVESGRDPGDLYRGGRLDVAAQWSAEHPDDLNEVEREFVAESLAARDAERADERARFEHQARANRRLRTLVGVTTVIAVIAAAAGIIALQQRRRANDQAAAAVEQGRRADEQAAEALDQAAIANAARDDAEGARAEALDALDDAARERTRAQDEADRARAANAAADLERLLSASVAEASRNPSLAVLLAVEAFRISEGSPAAADALQRTLVSLGGLESVISGAYIDVTLLDDGRSAVATGIKSVDVIDLVERRVLRSLDRPVVFGTEVAVSAAAGLVAISDADGTDIVDIDDGGVLFHSSEQANVLRWSPDGLELATISGGTMTIWSVADPTSPVEVDVADDVRLVAWHPDGTTWLLVRGDGRLDYVDRATGRTRWAQDGLDGADGPVLFSADGSKVAIALTSAVGPNAIHTFSVIDGERLAEPLAQADSVVDLAWMDEDKLEIAVATDPGRLNAWDLRAGIEIQPPIDATVTWALEYSPTLDRIVEASPLGVRLFRPRSETNPLSERIDLTPEQLSAGPTPLTYMALSGDGRRLLVSTPRSPFANVVEHDLDTGTSTVLDIAGAVVPAGEYTLLVNRQEMVVLDADLNPVGVPTPTPADPMFFAPSSDGRFFYVYRSARVLELYSTSTGLLGELDLPGDPPLPIDLSFSPDGDRVAIHYVGDQEDWAIIATATLEVITDGGPDEFRWPFLAGDTLYANPPYSDPPTADDLAILRLDPVTFSPVGEPLRGHTGSRWIVMESDELVATSSFDRTVRVWDRASGQQIGREIEIDAPFNLSGDGRRLVTIGPDGITVWNYDIDSWPAIACELAGRNLTATEWEQIGPRTVGYRATCDQYPIDG